MTTANVLKAPLGLYSAAAVANHFLAMGRESQRDLRPMKIQKLVYFAHGWHLALTELPLIDERVEAWTYGPVIPSLYRQLKKWGSGVIEEDIGEWQVQPSTDGSPGPKIIRFVPKLVHDDEIPNRLTFTQNLLGRIWKVYGSHSGPALSRMTHADGTPWAKTRKKNPGRRSIVIFDELMMQYFLEQLEKNKKRHHGTE